MKNFLLGKSPYIILFLILFMTLLLVIELEILKSRVSSNNNKDESSTLIRDEVMDYKVSLPIDPDSSSVNGVYINYVFFGPLKELKKTSEGLELFLDSSAQDLPRFVLKDGQARIEKVNADKSTTLAGIKDLRPGIRVNINLSYDVRAKVFAVRSVQLVDYLGIDQ